VKKKEEKKIPYLPFSEVVISPCLAAGKQKRD